MRIFFLLILFHILLLDCAGQEICNNGVDDDGDGLVDLYDLECICEGILVNTNQTALINNPDLELMTCCPQSFSEMTCAEGWNQGTLATTDYLNTCDYVLPAALAAGLVPFPSGEGAAGMIFSDMWKEYLATCLNSPFIAGIKYSLSFQIASLPVTPNFGQVCNNGIPDYDPVDVTLWGSPNCNFPLATVDCPEPVDPSWIPLGTYTYAPSPSWSQIDISFTPGVDISGIMIGPPCALPAGYSGLPCYAYFLIDDLSLYGEAEVYDLTLIDQGSPCDLEHLLIAELEPPGLGDWQWYYNGAAMSGQNGQEFSIADNNYLAGTYAVTFSTPEGCLMDSISVTVPPTDTLTEEVYVCAGDQAECAGESFFLSGVYEVHLESYAGCDSVVQCIIHEYAAPPVTFLTIDTCGPVEIEVCGNSFDQTGVFDVLCSNWQGCDSTILLDLRVLEAEAVIQQPEWLECGPNAQVELDGSASSFNGIPGGSTIYSWTGPPGGLNGPPDLEVAVATKPGLYCLQVSLESNGVYCTDSTCVTVESAEALPEPPMLNGGPTACLGDTILIHLTPGGGPPSTGFQWTYDSVLMTTQIDDLDVQYIPTELGTAEFCAIAWNECGASPATCILITTFPADTSLIYDQTCDTSQVGLSIFTWKNQHGCDSTVIISTTLLPSHQIIQKTTTCDPALVMLDTVLLQNQYGCDSLVITQTDLLPSSTKNIQLYTCDPLGAGLDTFNLTNQYGCDSIIYLTTTYSGIYQETNTALICGVGTDYADTLTVVSGPCDSLFITQYHYAALDTTWLTGTTCQAGQAGTFTQVLPGQSGCDSTIITTITLLQGDTTQVNDVTCVKADEQSDTLILQNQFGCDSMVILTIAYVGIDTQYVQKNSCDPAQVGVVIQSIPGTFCDTIRVTETTWVPFTESRDTITLCMASGPGSDTLVLAAQSGCDSLVINIYRYTDLQIDLAVTKESCAGDADGEIQVLTTDGGDPPYSYRLDGGAWQQTGTFTGLPPGLYTLGIKDKNDCLLQADGQIIEAGSILTLDAGPDRTEQLGEVINLSAQATTQLAEVQWTATDPLGCKTCLQSALGPLTVSQTVVVTVISLDGCPGQDELTVTVEERLTIYIPNSFSPNGDGINDIFTVYSNKEGLIVRNLDIFDRWGNALYDQKDLPVHDPTVGWNGTFRGDIMDPGVYVYVIKIELADGSQRYYKGDVTIIR